MKSDRNFTFKLLPGQGSAESHVQREQEDRLLPDQAQGAENQDVQEGQGQVEGEVSAQDVQEETKDQDVKGQDIQVQESIEMKTMSEK